MYVLLFHSAVHVTWQAHQWGLTRLIPSCEAHIRDGNVSITQNHSEVVYFVVIFTASDYFEIGRTRLSFSLAREYLKLGTYSMLHAHGASSTF